MEESQEDGGFRLDKKDLFIALALVGGIAFGVLLMFYLYNNNFPDQIISIKENSTLLTAYIQGFDQCRDFCFEKNKTGYLRAREITHHTCFCYDDGTKTMEAQ